MKSDLVGRHIVVILGVIGALVLTTVVAIFYLTNADAQQRHEALKRSTAAARARNALASDVGALRAQVRRLGGEPVAPPAAQTIAQIPGQPGATGAPGLTGGLGPRGPRGLPGIPGASGSPGVEGSTGPVGATGAKGDAGAKGDTGSTGADGAAGKDGAPGKDGAASTVAGPQGSVGPAGADSTVPGPPGAQGPAGPPGPTCPDGFTGSAQTVITVNQGLLDIFACVANPPLN